MVVGVIKVFNLIESYLMNSFFNLLVICFIFMRYLNNYFYIRKWFILFSDSKYFSIYDICDYSSYNFFFYIYI